MKSKRRGGYKNGRVSNEQLRSAARVLANAGAKRGGEARVAAMTPEERSALARLAARTRWERERAERELAERAARRRR